MVSGRRVVTGEGKVPIPICARHRFERAPRLVVLVGLDVVSEVRGAVRTAGFGGRGRGK